MSLEIAISPAGRLHIEATPELNPRPDGRLGRRVPKPKGIHLACSRPGFQVIQVRAGSLRLAQKCGRGRHLTDR